LKGKLCEFGAILLGGQEVIGQHFGRSAVSVMVGASVAGGVGSWRAVAANAISIVYNRNYERA